MLYVNRQFYKRIIRVCSLPVKDQIDGISRISKYRIAQGLNQKESEPQRGKISHLELCKNPMATKP